MINKIRKRVIQFIKNENRINVNIAFTASIASGLYPLLQFYNSNFTLMNSWSQFMFFIVFFLIFPSLVFLGFLAISNYFNLIKGYSKYIISFLNYVFFGSFIVIITLGFNKFFLLIVLVLAIVLANLLRNHFRKIIVFQLILAVFVFIKLLPDFYKYFLYSDDWMTPLDSIETVKFKKNPNIYFIQPDGYANFSEINKGYYNFNNEGFEVYLKDKKFKSYKDFRSNYYSTLSSNSSLFAMKHHYYNNTNLKKNELYNAREIIAGKNTALSILKKNGYKTSLLLEYPYLLVNRPKLFYDYCNIDFNEISFFASGFNFKKDISIDLLLAIENNRDNNNFYFIEKLLPGHIHNIGFEETGEPREVYIKAVKKANEWLQNIVNLILDKDSNALIIIAADHGGFVGLESTGDSRIKQADEDLVKSIFTSALAIKWPNNDIPYFDTKLKTSVNLFRVLFSYLSENENYLNYLEDDKSYVPIEKGAPSGIYECINAEGQVVYKQVSN